MLTISSTFFPRRAEGGATAVVVAAGAAVDVEAPVVAAAVVVPRVGNVVVAVPGTAVTISIGVSTF